MEKRAFEGEHRISREAIRDGGQEMIELKRLSTNRSRRSDHEEMDLAEHGMQADAFLRHDPVEDGEADGLENAAAFMTPQKRARRKERKRAMSVASSAQNNRRGKKSMVNRQARKALRRLKRARSRRDSHSSGSSTSSSSSSSSSSSGSSRSSGGVTRPSAASTHSHSSSFSFPNWRFWRDSSSSSSSGSSNSSDSSNSYIPPDPFFTLMTPNLSVAKLDGSAAFEIYESSTLAPALLKLSSLWSALGQTDPSSGDLGGVKDVPPPAVAPSALGSSHPTRPSSPLNTPAWWLDVLCPTPGNMRTLRKLLPLHPLTIEDILQQDTREKIEHFDRLGYQFIVFRALDESYFKYSSPSNSADSISPERPEDGSLIDEKSEAASAKTIVDSLRDRNQTHDNRRATRGKLEIVEGVGGKEGVEGVGVGAVNLYLVIYEDGIISFRFEPLDKHLLSTRRGLQEHGLMRNIDSQWIAYSMMDSIVDAFFPLINFIEGESKELDDYLADPLGDGLRQHYSIESHATVHSGKKIHSKRPIRKLEVTQTQIYYSLPGPFRNLALPSYAIPFLPASLVQEHTRTQVKHMAIGNSGEKVLPDQYAYPSKPRRLGEAIGASLPFDPKTLVQRIADSRKLVTGMSRLLGPKTDVVRGMRKRSREMGDISMYLGDLQDHIVTMQQNLSFYDVILSHDHPVLVGILRLALEATKIRYAKTLVYLYCVTLTFITTQVITNTFTLNVQAPRNGDRETHLEPDGSVPPKIVFGCVVAGVSVAMGCVFTLMWSFLRDAKKRTGAKIGTL